MMNGLISALSLVHSQSHENFHLLDDYLDGIKRILFRFFLFLGSLTFAIK